MPARAPDRGVPVGAAEGSAYRSLNRVSAVVQAYDPCLSCSTHALGMVPVKLSLVGPDGEVLDEMATD